MISVDSVDLSHPLGLNMPGSCRWDLRGLRSEVGDTLVPYCVTLPGERTSIHNSRVARFLNCPSCTAIYGSVQTKKSCACVRLNLVLEYLTHLTGIASVVV